MLRSCEVRFARNAGNSALLVSVINNHCANLPQLMLNFEMSGGHRQLSSAESKNSCRRKR